ncbi:MAG: N-acetyltransferase family protein [Acidimicrobiia bacterium]
MSKRRRTVKIEQPTANKVIVFGFASLSGFLTLLFITANIGSGFKVVLVTFLAGILFYAYRAIQVVAIADDGGVEVRNLVRHRRIAWSKIDALSVGRTGSGPGTGITVELLDGSSMNVESSWGPWYQGKVSAANTVRCEKLIDRINTMRAHDPDLDGAGEPEQVDPIVVRPTLPEDADAAAETIDAAWRETFADILPLQTLRGRDPSEDAQMLRELLDAAAPRSGSLVVERSGEIVGASVFGPTGGGDLDGYTEIYMLYVRADEIGKGAGRRLVLRTLGAIRASGATGVVGHVYVNNRRFRSQLKRLGIEPYGDTQEQIWYGLPVRVVEYRLPL